MLINKRCENCPQNNNCTKKYKTEIVTSIDDLPEDVQKLINADIENRLLPQAELQFKIGGIKGAAQYVNNEIQKADNTIQEITKEAYNDSHISYLDIISKIVVYNIERKKMLQKFINDHKIENQRTIELNPSQKEAFIKAIEAGVMEKTESGYRWLHNNGMKASLAYFLEQTFAPNKTEQIPYQSLEKLFDVTRLDTALNQVHNAKNSQKWRTDIDKIFSE